LQVEAALLEVGAVTLKTALGEDGPDVAAEANLRGPTEGGPNTNESQDPEERRERGGDSHGGKFLVTQAERGSEQAGSGFRL
jgi:hypothetical protein